MTNENLETECFGGSYKVARQDKSKLGIHMLLIDVIFILV